MITLILVMVIIQCICSLFTIYLIVNYLGVKVTFDAKKRGEEDGNFLTPRHTLTDEEKDELEDLKRIIKDQDKAFQTMLTYSPEMAYGIDHTNKE